MTEPRCPSCTAALAHNSVLITALKKQKAWNSMLGFRAEQRAVNLANADIDRALTFAPEPNASDPEVANLKRLLRVALDEMSSSDPFSPDAALAAEIRAVVGLP